MDIRSMTAEQKDLLKAGIIKAADAWPSLYETESGEVFQGRLLEDTKSDMIKAGWRNISGYRLDEDDCRRLGIRVERARYIGGVRKKAFARAVIYIRPKA
jgi:hypothetical protein